MDFPIREEGATTKEVGSTTMDLRHRLWLLLWLPRVFLLSTLLGQNEPMWRLTMACFRNVELQWKRRRRRKRRKKRIELVWVQIDVPWLGAIATPLSRAVHGPTIVL